MSGQRFEVADPVRPAEGESLALPCPFCGHEMVRGIVDAADGRTKVHYACLLLFQAAARWDLEGRQDAQAGAELNPQEPF